jgi:hypothetical protein
MTLEKALRPFKEKKSVKAFSMLTASETVDKERPGGRG